MHASTRTMNTALGFTMRVVEAECSIDSADVTDRLAAMKQQEESYRWRMYFSESRVSEGNCANKVDAKNIFPPEVRLASEIPTAAVDEQCRVVMCGWCYQVASFFNFKRETVYVAISHVDRFLSINESQPVLRNRNLYQLVVVTALHIAIKTNETTSLDVNLLVKLGRSWFTVPQIFSMEIFMLQKLFWKVNPPTPAAFVQHLCALAPQTIDAITKHSLLDFAQYQCELSLFDHNLSAEDASVVAVASLLNCMDGMDRAHLSEDSRDIFTRSILMAMDMKTSRVFQSRRQLLKTIADTVGLDTPNFSLPRQSQRALELERTRAMNSASPVGVSL